MVNEIVLSRPDSVLSPNKRVHWTRVHRARRRARNDAYYAALEAQWQRVAWPTGRLFVWIDAFPPDRRRRDEDNLLASLKGHLDGVAIAMQVDDSRFVPRPYIKDEVRRNGEVHVRITGGLNLILRPSNQR